MVQRHSIILWKKAEAKENNFEEIAKEAYKVLNIFQDYPTEFRPNYLTANTKKDIKEFNWNFESFSDVLRKGINTEGKNVFEDLGYSISFFSSMKEQDACSFQMRVGNRNDKFYNTLVVSLPYSVNVFDEEVSVIICGLFEKLVQAYHPFWGCVSNKALSIKYGKYLEGNLPTTVHWINYWSEDIIGAIGREKIQKIMEKNAIIFFKDGIFKVRNTALDMDKDDDIIFHSVLQTQLFLQ